MDDSGWQEQKPRKNKKKNVNNHYDNMPVTTDHRTRNFSNTPDKNYMFNTQEMIDTTIKKKGDITILMKYMLDGDIEKQINEKLNILKCTYDGKICKLWDVLFICLKNISSNIQSFQECNELRNYFNKNNQNQKNYIDDDTIYEICNYFKIQLKISSIDKNTRDIVYKGNLFKIIHLLHVGFEYFIPLKSGLPDNKYKISTEETKLISELRILNKNTGVNQRNLEREKKLLYDIRKKLMGMEKKEDYAPPANNRRKNLFYRIYSPEWLNERKDLIQCKLKFINAHSGKAIPADHSAYMKCKEIKLISRQNCGYNAFENDIVLVKINDPVNFTGKVVDVVESNHKPVNSVYICKVSRDQGSLMTPLDKSFPKIHVDNEPGRRKYEKNHSKVLADEQKSTIDIEKESAKYADNLYYSLFDINVFGNSEKPVFKLKKVENFNPETCEYFFIVCYEYWDPHFMYPNGKIVGTISSHESLKDNFHLISSICNIEPLETSPQYKKEVEKIKEKSKCVHVPDSYIPSESVVFTIDDITTKDMDDAISYHKDGNDVIIGVHISDVTKYVSPTHEIYRQAETRFCTFYPPKFSNIPPVHILDESLATDVFSLVPEKPRAVVSVFFRFTENMISSDFKDFELADIIQPTFKEGIIVSQYKLNYDEVSIWLRAKEIPSTVNENLFYAISLIYNIAKKIRRARLPESYFVHSVNDCYNDMKIETNFEAHILIEEFMLMANEYVARKIYETYPNFSLLRMQDPVKNFEEWKENLFKLTNMNFAGQLKEYCNLLKIKVADFETKKKLVVSKKFVEKFNELLKIEPEKARNLLQYDVYYNDFYVHITEWYEINHAARYECSIKDCVTNGHFSLNKGFYTHFTSPIRRFVDIVVHRLLKSVIKGIRIDNDITLDIPRVCTIANKKLSGNQNFEKICAPFAIFDETDKTFCFILDCVCSEINNEELRFAHPLLQKSASRKEINFADLSLDSVPISLKINDKVESCVLKWKKIIFSCSSLETSNPSSNRFVIDSNVFDCFLLDSSHKLFQEIRRSYLPTEKLSSKLNDLKLSFISPKYKNVISSDSISISNPIIDIEIKIFIKNTLRIQFCKYKVNGLPKINPELYIVAPTFQICLIHSDDPVRFFISGGKLKLKHNDIKKVFGTIKEYQEYFEPLILIESLEETLADSSAFTLLSVPILWVVGPSSVSSCRDRYGVIILSQEFCKIRNIIFNDEKEEVIDRYEYLIEKGFSSVGGDLLCLRYKMESWKNYWVGHGEVVYVGKYRNEENHICKVIIFRLTQSDYDSFSNNSENGKYSIDVYLKSVVSKRQQEAISSINNHPLLKEVILGRQELSPSDYNDDFINSLKNHIQNKFAIRLNKNQYNAMYNAMNQKLSLIWGPPGTGKTQIGCILSYGFTQTNHDKKNAGVVLYCGPSNDCVNLVASEMQKKFSDSCPKLLRIFGEQQELADFPIPGFISKNNVKLTGEISEISLHYLIRKSGAKYADALKKYDNHFSYILNPDSIYTNSDNNLEKLHKTIMAYRDTVKDAKKQWIKDNGYDMVLCTTSVTALSIMELFNITQVIIDEAGMCKEPETLIPISSVEKTVQNVVLIGDHKQLRPIIHSKVANKRGLQISLFERYQELKPKLVTMLNFQYRMHPSICEFPSREFYRGRLKTQISNLWTGLNKDDMKSGESYFEWNGIDYKKCKGHYKSVLKSSNYNAIPNEKWPAYRTDFFRCFKAEFEWYPERIVFFHVIGDEITQSVTTSTGNENSRGNKQEVEAVGCIYRKLIKRLDPPRQAPSFITVLTQYKLQQHLIQLQCKEILKSENIRKEPQVKTVIRSQGSENDYIIFSTVRSLRNKEDINENPTPGWEKQYLGFITDPNQVNVALTRAKKGLIIIGNKELLRVNKIWKRLISDLENRNCVLENYLDFLP